MLARANRLASLLRGGSPTLGSDGRWLLSILWGGHGFSCSFHRTSPWSSRRSCTEHGQKPATNLLTARYNQKPQTRQSCLSDLNDQKRRKDGNKQVKNHNFRTKTEIKGAFFGPQTHKTHHRAAKVPKKQPTSDTKKLQKEANADKDQHTERKHRGGRLNRFTARAGSLFEAILPVFAATLRLFEVLLLPSRLF